MVGADPTRLAWYNTSGIAKYAQIFLTASNTMFLHHGDGTATSGVRISVLVGGSGGADFLFTSTGLDCLGESIRDVGDISLDSITKEGAGNILFNDIIDMGGRALVNVGDVELDSLTKDGAGAILLNDDFDMNSNALLKVSDITPPSDNTGQCGTVGLTWNLGAFTDINLNGVTYTFPASDGGSGDRLQTNGSGVLSWVTP